jgi:diaminopimelate decarboxylase
MTLPTTLPVDGVTAAVSEHYARLLRLAGRELGRGRPTPFVAFDFVRMHENAARFRALQTTVPGVAVRIAAAVKACPVAPVLTRLDGVVDHFEVQSPHEARLCPPGAALAVNAPLLEVPPPPADVRWLSFNSGEQWRAYDFARAGRTTPDRRHGIRLAVASGEPEPFVAPGRKFGLEPDDAVEALASRREEVYFHQHTHRRLHDPGVGAAAARRFARLATVVASRAGHRVRTLDLGGGWDGGFEAALAGVRGEMVAAAQLAAVREVAPDLGEVVLEPGRALFEDTAVAVATVGETIRRRSSELVVIDLASNFLVPNPGARFRVAPVGTHGGGGWRQTVVVDGTCRPRGVVANQPLPVSLRPSDPLAIVNVGAYTYSFASAFAGPPPPAIGFESDDEPVDLLTRDALEEAWALGSGLDRVQ